MNELGCIQKMYGINPLGAFDEEIALVRKCKNAPFKSITSIEKEELFNHIENVFYNGYPINEEAEKIEKLKQHHANTIDKYLRSGVSEQVKLRTKLGDISYNITKMENNFFDFFDIDLKYEIKNQKNLIIRAAAVCMSICFDIMPGQIINEQLRELIVICFLYQITDKHKTNLKTEIESQYNDMVIAEKMKK